MANKVTGRKARNVGFISTRLAGTDGVSLEAEKWAYVFQSQGCECYYMAGELDHPPEKSHLALLAHFNHPEILAIQDECFDRHERRPAVAKEIHDIKDKLKVEIREFVRRFGLDLLVVENALAIPMNIPFGLALTEFISETCMPTIAHHHDFFWERQRFLKNCVWDYLNMAFPPHIPAVQHVVINSSADNQLSLRTGISATTVPNVMDFEHPPAEPDEYARDVRQSLGLEDDELLILQPTRVVKRKGIEHAIELVRRLGMKARLVITHASGDEGHEYEQRVRDYSKLMGVNTVFVCRIIDDQRGMTDDGRKVYSLDDVYPYADLVTYPSDFEGFGNAFLEAVYFRRPIVVNNYSIYSTDIEPKGFKVIEIDGYVTEEALQKTRQWLRNPEIVKEATEHNYALGRRYFSYSILQHKIRNLIIDCLGEPEL